MDRTGSSGATGAGAIGGDVNSELGLALGGNPERHPTIDNVNALLAERLSPTEHICLRIAALTGAPAALVAAIVLQFVWIGIGLVTRWDPYARQNRSTIQRPGRASLRTDDPEIIGRLQKCLERIDRSIEKAQPLLKARKAFR
jgi:hypothetical protein